MSNKIQRIRRHKRITKIVKGTQEQPRLVVFRSKKHIYAQLVDDSTHRVLTAVSTLSKAFQEKKVKSSDKNAAKVVGSLMAAKILEIGVKQVCFDRGGYKYHGRVKSLAEGAREGGVKF